MTYEPLYDKDEPRQHPPSRLATLHKHAAAHLEYLRDTGTTFLRRGLTLAGDREAWITLLGLLGSLAVVAFFVFWAYAFFGGIWAAITYDAAGAKEKALAAEAAKNAALIKPVMDKLAEMERELRGLGEVVDRLGGGRQHEL